MAISRESCGLLYILMSAVLYSIAGAFLKKSTDIPSTEIVFFRTVFQGFFVILGMLRFREESLPSDNGREGQLGNSEQYSRQEMTDGDSPVNCVDVGDTTTHAGTLLIKVPLGRPGRERNLVVLRGFVGGGFGFICYSYSIKSLPLGDAIALLSVYPVYTIFLAKFYLDESITRSHIIATILNVIGGILIAGPSFLSYKNEDDVVYNGQYNPLGYITALFGGFVAALVIILLRKAGTLGVHILQLLFSWCCFGLILSVAFGFTLGALLEGTWVFPSDRETWLYIFGTCAVGIMAQVLFNYAGMFAPAGLCALVRSTDILWAYMIEVVAFEESPRFTTIAGVVLILASLTMIAIEKIRDEMGAESYKLLNKEAEDATMELDGSDIEMT
jgi:drug/metabolite transporter (DMT)-like permease